MILLPSAQTAFTFEVLRVVVVDVLKGIVSWLGTITTGKLDCWYLLGDLSLVSKYSPVSCIALLPSAIQVCLRQPVRQNYFCLGYDHHLSYYLGYDSILKHTLKGVVCPTALNRVFTLSDY